MPHGRKEILFSLVPYPCTSLSVSHLPHLPLYPHQPQRFSSSLLGSQNGNPEAGRVHSFGTDCGERPITKTIMKGTNGILKKELRIGIGTDYRKSRNSLMPCRTPSEKVQINFLAENSPDLEMLTSSGDTYWEKTSQAIPPSPPGNW